MQKKVYLVLTKYFYTDKSGIEHQTATDELNIDVFNSLKKAKEYIEWSKNYELEKGNAIEWENSNEYQVVSNYYSGQNTYWRKVKVIIEKYTRNY